LTRSDLAALAKNSFAASWLEEDEKQALMAKTESYLVANS
jgi:adenosine deaminase